MSRARGWGREHRSHVCLHLPAMEGRKNLYSLPHAQDFEILLCEEDALCKEKRANQPASKKRYEVVAEVTSKGMGASLPRNGETHASLTCWMPLLCYPTPEKPRFLSGLCAWALWSHSTSFSRTALQADPDEIQACCSTALLLQLCRR